MCDELLDYSTSLDDVHELEEKIKEEEDLMHSCQTASTCQTLYDVCDELLEYVNAIDVAHILEANKEVDDLSSSFKGDGGKNRIALRKLIRKLNRIALRKLNRIEL